MCGIFGLVSTRGPLDARGFRIPNETEVLRHRGPDAAGYYIDRSVYLGHRRLSIIDIESGTQPVFNEDGTVCVVFNGEIFNFREIRLELEKAGHRFKTNSDTEVIVHSYEEWGGACVERFRGMFAFAVRDTVRNTVFLARDRLGIKPLFYALWKGVFYFASEMKAILQFPDFPREIDRDALASFFTLSYIPWPLTIFRHIRKLPPASRLEVSVDSGAGEPVQYWDLHFCPDHSKDKNYFIEKFMSLLAESVELRLISDVPLGAFLSGGLDSGAVVSAMSRISPEPVRTFCIGFGGEVGGYLDERRYARDVSAKCGTIHREFEVRPDLRGIMDAVTMSFDEPFADPGSIPSYYVCETARKHVTVALSGLGGDEVFGGYERYLGFKQSILYGRLPRLLREKIIRPCIEGLSERADGHYTVNHLKRFVRWASSEEGERYFGFISMLGENGGNGLFAEPQAFRESFATCQDLVLRHFNAPADCEPLDRVFYCDIKTYLPEDILACTDRMSMRHALEVRVPFLDHKLMEFCATIPSGMKVRNWNKKYLLKKALAGILPEGVITHRKQGFIGPMTHWLKNDLRPYVLDVLSEANLGRHGMLNAASVRTILDEHFSGREIHDKLIWSLIMFQNWFSIYIENGYPSLGAPVSAQSLPLGCEGQSPACS